MLAVKYLWTFSCHCCVYPLKQKHTILWVKIDWVIITQLYLRHFSTSPCYNAFIIPQKFTKDITVKSTNVSWITQQEISKQRKHDVEQKCSYFCVGCLSPNSLMLSCKESWRQKRGETSRVSVGVEEGEWSLALQPGQLQQIFQQEGSDISSSSLLSTMSGHNEGHVSVCWFLCLAESAYLMFVCQAGWK